jgi:hypothetical protein
MSKKEIDPSEAARALGRLGRAANTEAQAEASRANGAKGGRPPASGQYRSIVEQVRSMFAGSRRPCVEVTCWRCKEPSFYYNGSIAGLAGFVAQHSGHALDVRCGGCCAKPCKCTTD